MLMLSGEGEILASVKLHLTCYLGAFLNLESYVLE